RSRWHLMGPLAARRVAFTFRSGSAEHRRRRGWLPRHHPRLLLLASRASRRRPVVAHLPPIASQPSADRSPHFVLQTSGRISHQLHHQQLDQLFALGTQYRRCGYRDRAISIRRVFLSYECAHTAVAWLFLSTPRDAPHSSPARATLRQLQRSAALGYALWHLLQSRSL